MAKRNTFLREKVTFNRPQFNELIKGKGYQKLSGSTRGRIVGLNRLPFSYKDHKLKSWIWYIQLLLGF